MLMKKKKVRDRLIGSFLMLSLCLAGFLVSCTEDDGFLLGPNLNGSDPTVGAGTSGSAMSNLFLSLGKGAASEVGGELSGWALSAMGLSNSSSNYQHQINQILNDLNAIEQTLTDIDNTLQAINQAINFQTCSQQAGDLDNDIAFIKQVYNSGSQSYHNIIQRINDSVQVPTSDMKGFADKVLAKGVYSGQEPLSQYLDHMATNLNRNTGAIVSCMQTINDPVEGVLHGDTVYYNQVNNIFNYYYYWQALGLNLLSEAEHFYAWYEAGQPGGTYTSSDSIQKVCDTNSISKSHCLSVVNATNQMYNDLLVQATYVGAPYSSENFTYQHFDSNPVVWVKSLEAFTTEAGYNCTSPLTNSNPCGPASGYFYTKLTDSSYWNTTASFRFATGSELRNLINVSQVGSMTNGAYLESQGFMNMSNKTIMASDSVRVYPAYTGYDGSLQTIVPFFNTDVTPLNNGHSIESVMYTQNDFQGILLHATHESNRDGNCGPHNSYTSRLYHYHYNSTLGAKENWLVTYAKTRVCEDNSIVSSFEYTDHNYNGSTCCLPGYLTSQQRKKASEKRYLFPVFSPQSALCTNNRSQNNSGSVPSMCGDDFTAYLNINIPRPESCDKSCTVLQ